MIPFDNLMSDHLLGDVAANSSAPFPCTYSSCNPRTDLNTHASGSLCSLPAVE